MPNRHSSMAYRSSLMEAECRAQFIRQHKTESGDRVSPSMHRLVTVTTAIFSYLHVFEDFKHFCDTFYTFIKLGVLSLIFNTFSKHVI